MKKINKGKQPKEYKLSKLAFYKNLKNSNGNVKPRWNNSPHKEFFEEIFEKIFDSECVFCGAKERTLDIEHYLPTSKFPYLSYAYDNLLLSCKYCNQTLKRNISPESLDGINYGEKYLIGEIDGIVEYNKKKVLKNIEDRLIEPTFDDIEKHIEFKYDTGVYIDKTNIGRITNTMFFSKKTAEIINRIKYIVMLLVKENKGDDVLKEIIETHGYSYYYRTYFEYWTDFFE